MYSFLLFRHLTHPLFVVNGLIILIITLYGFTANAQADITVTGIGCSGANGTYTPNGIANNAPKWSNGAYTIKYESGGLWALYNTTESILFARVTCAGATYLPCSGWEANTNDQANCGAPTLSGGCGVVAVPISLIASSSSSSVCAGGSVSLSVTATNGSSPYSYTWVAPAGASISGPTNASTASVVINANTTGTQTFTIKVADSSSPTLKRTSTIDIDVPAIGITTEPTASSAVCVGNAVSVPVSASGAITKYQWYKGSTALGSQMSATLSLPSPTTADAGVYALVITGSCKSLTTTPFSLSVNELAGITQEPVGSSAVCSGSSITVPVSVTGANARFQWYKGNNLVTNQTTATLSFPAATTAEAGAYSLVVTGECNSVTSKAFNLTVNALPMISINPSTTTIIPGESVTLTASGASSYTWSTSSSLTAISVSPLTPTSYSVSATDDFGCIGQASAWVSFSCVAPVAQALPPIVGVLGAGNCPISVQLQGIGNSFVLTGQEGYVFSNVYRRQGTYPVKANGIKSPGLYTLLATATNDCGQTSTQSVTFMITGEGCK